MYSRYAVVRQQGIRWIIPSDVLLLGLLRKVDMPNTKKKDPQKSFSCSFCILLKEMTCIDVLMMNACTLIGASCAALAVVQSGLQRQTEAQ